LVLDKGDIDTEKVQLVAWCDMKAIQPKYALQEVIVLPVCGLFRIITKYGLNFRMSRKVIFLFL
jgi:hypothetical protein